MAAVTMEGKGPSPPSLPPLLFHHRSPLVIFRSGMQLFYSLPALRIPSLPLPRHTIARLDCKAFSSTDHLVEEENSFRTSVVPAKMCKYCAGIRKKFEGDFANSIKTLQGSCFGSVPAKCSGANLDWSAKLKK